ncbi:hypothetical protein EBU71_07570 [bacterium]|nr:hypothetical protein [Candidatus Elulimicrobium humile]
MIKKFPSFDQELLLESILEVDTNFFDIINSISTASGIEKKLIEWILQKTDIKTNYNFLSPGNTNDKINYLQDRQFQRFKETGADLSQRTKIDTTIGRLVRSMLQDNGEAVSETQIEEFVNAYKSAWNQKFEPRQFSIVSGPDINFWYLESNYYAGGKSQLGNSCMRYAKVNPRMNLYSGNPDKVSMFILTDNDPSDGGKSKLLARALIWKLDDGKTYVDRIYFNSDDIYEESNNWLHNKFPSAIHRERSKPDLNISCTLKNANLPNYPYVDSLFFMEREIKDGKYLGDQATFYLKEQPEKKNFVRFQLTNHSTGIATIRSNHVYIDEVDKIFPKSDLILIYPKREYYPKSLCDWSELYGSYIKKLDSIYSDYHQSFILKSKSTTLEGFGLVDKDYIFIYFDRFVGDPNAYPWQVWDAFIQGEEIFSQKGILKPDTPGEKRKYFKPDVIGNTKMDKNWVRPFLARDFRGYKTVNIFTIPVWEIDMQKVTQYLRQTSRNIRDFVKYTYLLGILSINYVKNSSKGITERNFILEEDAEILGITRFLGEKEYFVNVWELSNFISILEYDTFERMVDNCQGLTQDQKTFRKSLQRWLSDKNTGRIIRVSFDRMVDFLDESKEFFTPSLMQSRFDETKERILYHNTRSGALSVNLGLGWRGQDKVVELVDKLFVPQNMDYFKNVVFWYSIVYCKNGNSSSVTRNIQSALNRNVDYLSLNPEDRVKISNFVTLYGHLHGNVSEFREFTKTFKKWQENKIRDISIILAQIPDTDYLAQAVVNFSL